jgi:hypothetical protein
MGSAWAYNEKKLVDRVVEFNLLMKGQSAERLEVLSAKLSFLRHEASRRLLSAHEVCSYSENDCREYFADYQPITGGPDFSRLHSAAILLRSESEVYYGQVQ